MKKLQLFCFITAFGSLLSCSNNDDDFAMEPRLEGKWNYNSRITTFNGENPQQTGYGNHEPDCEKDFQEFVEGGVLKRVVWNKNTLNQCVIDDSDVSEWSRQGNQLTIGNEIFEITRLTNSELRYASSSVSGNTVITITNVFTKN